MPTPDEIKKQKELNDLLEQENRILREKLKLQSESYDLSSSLVEDLKDVLGIQSRRNTFDSGVLDINKKINKAIRDQRIEFDEIEDVQKQIKKNADLINKAKLFETSLENQLKSLGRTKSEKDKNRIENLNIFNKAIVKQYEQLDNILALSKEEKDLRKDEIKELRNKIARNEQLIQSNFKNLSLSSQQFYLTQKQKEELEKINLELAKEEEKRKEIQKQLGVFGGALKGLEKIPVLKNLGIDFKKIREEAENTTEKTKSGVQGLGSGLKSLGNQLKTSLTNPANITLFLMQQMLVALQKADKETGELAKAFGTSYSEAASLRNELNNIANSSGDINVTTSALQKSLIAVNKEFGTATMLSGELLKDFTQLTEVAGYTNDAAARLSKISVATGTDLSNNTAEILGTAKAFNATNKLALNEKEIVEEVAKASKATTLSLGMQPGKLAQAVAQAKALGANLEKVEAISQSLLNFESSIASELEAELLTGKDMNLERARMYALNNDIAGVAKEIAGQIGSAANFTKMNVIQQEALAKSVGMTREDLAASLIERQALAAIGEGDKTALEAYNRLRKEGLSDEQIRVRLGDDALANQLKSQSIQERFNASIEKLKEIFVSIAQPLLPILDILASVFQLIGKIVSLINPIIQTISAFLGGVTDLLSLDFNFTNFNKGFSNFNESLVKDWKMPKDFVYYSIGDMFSPSNGKTQVSTKEGGLFELSPNDDLMAAPDLKNKINKSSSSISSDMSKVEALLSQLIQKQDRPVQVSVEMDGEKVAKGVGQNSTKLGNSMSTNTYQVQ